MIVEVDQERATELIEKAARFIAERRMSPAAIMAIESLKPLNYIGSQLMYFLLPFAEVIFNSKEYQEFAALLQNDKYVEQLLKRIDELDFDLHHKEREKKRLIRKRRLKKIKNFIKKLFRKKK